MVNITIQLDVAQRKMSPQAQRRGQYALANQALADMNRFVPMKEGILRQTATIAIDGSAVYYNTPYAEELFYMPKFNYTTPGTGPRWDNKAKGILMNDWKRAYVKGADW